MTEQEKEIKTVKERNITVKLSDADVEKISKKVGMGGITVGELIENFIGDLINGTYTNGSDEVDRANSYFERCWFSWMNDDSLLHHLLEWSHDVDDFLSTYDELEYLKKNPKKVEEDKGFYLSVIEEDYHDYVDDYLKNHKDIDIKKEIDTCRKWFKEMQELKGK